MTATDERHIDRLVRRAVRGDATAFGSIYDAYVDRVYAFVCSRVRDAHDAEDVTETVFLKAFEAIRDYDLRGLPFGAWLFRIARNATIDFVRRSARTPDAVEDIGDYIGPADDDVEAEVDARIGGETVRAAVGRLTEEQAAVIACRYFWDMDIRTTARVLDRTQGAVKALQHRALRSLAKVLEEMSGDE
ncbi:MAG: RNA polymerase sigma factor [Coriobacteriia bacterium]|nr:RNA polymerase sigma factor [Coriobacteriia bacterium]